MDRRSFIGTAAAAALPRIAIAQPRRVVNFIPLGDVAVLDPHRTAVKVTAHHGYMIFDTLYGIDDAFKVQPQMVAGHTMSQDGLVWELTLRDGLAFHDGQPVLARDAVASIRRWAMVDPFGGVLMQYTDALSAASDKMIRFRLKKPFPLLPMALGKTQPTMCAIMPERLAQTAATTAITEMVGSGPFRYVAAEWVPGALHVYEKNAAYVPRPGGQAQQTAGPKIVHVDRVEWHVINDASTAVASLQSGAMDWWERPTFDMLPLLARNEKLTVLKNDPLGELGALILNKAQPPFNNPAICRAMFEVIDQTDMMQAVAGTDASYWRTGVGCFAPASPWANTAGLDGMGAPRNPETAKRALAAAGYAGERVVMMVGSDIPDILAMSQVGESEFRKAGLNVEFQSSDWGTVTQRRLNRKPVSDGGWSCYFVPLPGSYLADPILSPQFRGTGDVPGNGFTTSPRLEEILAQWLVTPDSEKMKLAEALQSQTRIDVPFVPAGNYVVPTVFRKVIRDMVSGSVIKFWGLTKDA